MAWVPFQDSGLSFDFSVNSPVVALSDSTITSSANDPNDDSGWWLEFDGPQPRLRVTAVSYAAVTDFDVSTPCHFLWGDELQTNESGTPESAFSPSPFEFGPPDQSAALTYNQAQGSEWSVSDAYQFLIEVWQEGPPGCEEIGRASRAYVSAYDRSRVHVGRFRRQERRCVVANFNGAIPVNRSIASVTWRCTAPWVTKMSGPAIDGREVTVTVDFQNPGIGALKATVTLDNGEIYNQAFEFEVRDSPWFHENLAIAAGPYSVTAGAD